MGTRTWPGLASWLDSRHKTDFAKLSEKFPLSLLLEHWLNQDQEKSWDVRTRCNLPTIPFFQLLSRPKRIGINKQAKWTVIFRFLLLHDLHCLHHYPLLEQQHRRCH